MNTCHLCHAVAVDELRDFGLLPVCNRLLDAPAEKESHFPLVLGQCSRCGLLQISHPVPPEQLRTRHPWITYSEPTGHLAGLAATVAALPGMTLDSTLLGIFLPTDTALEWFKAKGFKNARRLDLQSDLGIDDACAGTESLQARLDAETAEGIIAKRGRPDVIIMRHILEHAHDVGRLMKGLRRLAKPEGYVIFEVPDCESALTNKDYTMLWEEHVSYFTGPTFTHCLATHGWRTVYTEQTGVSLIAIAQPDGTDGNPRPPAYPVAEELGRGRAFASAFPETKDGVLRFARDFTRCQGKIAVFGAGHLSCMFINLMDLTSHLCCVIDDHEKKQGMFMPGSRLPIHSSRALVEEDIALCLSSLGRETDARLLSKNPWVRDFSAKGGKLRPFFPGENHFLTEAAV